MYFNISFDKTSSKSFKKPKYIIKMVVKTPLSSTDPIKEQEDGWSLDLENVHLQRGSLDKSCSKSFRQLKFIIKMVIKTPLSSTDPIKEQEDRWSLELTGECKHKRNFIIKKSCSKSIHLIRNTEYIVKVWRNFNCLIMFSASELLISFTLFWMSSVSMLSSN